ncbi:hypothetical protein ACFCZ3_20090 [Cellulosimicrobium cellulans]|uniref:hypothetical protein n=1 Tax=Cellulosimicrobium cellulans TaxID=1710 RepID=UPI0035D95E1E
MTRERPRATVAARLLHVLTRTAPGRALGIGAWLIIVGALAATGTGYRRAVVAATVAHVVGALALHAAHARLNR